QQSKQARQEPETSAVIITAKIPPKKPQAIEPMSFIVLIKLFRSKKYPIAKMTEKRVTEIIPETISWASTFLAAFGRLTRLVKKWLNWTPVVFMFSITSLVSFCLSCDCPDVSLVFVSASAA